MPPAPQPQRRRLTDRGQEQALDLLNERLNRQARRLDSLEDKIDAVARDLREDMREDTADLRGDIRELRVENRTAHKRVAYGTDPEDGKTPLPPQPATLTWGGVLKVASAVSLVLGPIAIIVAALLQGSS